MSRLAEIQAELAILKPKVAALEAEAKQITEEQVRVASHNRWLEESKKREEAEKSRLEEWYKTEEGGISKQNEEMYAARRAALAATNGENPTPAQKMLRHEDDMWIVKTFSDDILDGEYRGSEEDVLKNMEWQYLKRKFASRFGRVSAAFLKDRIERGGREEDGDWEEYLQEFNYSQYVKVDSLAKGIIDWCIGRHNYNLRSYSIIDFSEEKTILKTIYVAGNKKTDAWTDFPTERLSSGYSPDISSDNVEEVAKLPWEYELNINAEYERIEDSDSGSDGDGDGDSGSDDNYDDDDNKSYNYTLSIKFDFPKPEPVVAKPRRVFKLKKPIVIPEKEFVAEHKELISTLKADNPVAIAKEAAKQSQELKAVLKKPLEKHTIAEIATMIRQHLAKKNMKAALSHLNKTQIVAAYKKIVSA